MPPILTTQTAETFTLVGILIGLGFLMASAILTLRRKK